MFLPAQAFECFDIALRYWELLPESSFTELMLLKRMRDTTTRHQLSRYKEDKVTEFFYKLLNTYVLIVPPPQQCLYM